MSQHDYNIANGGGAAVRTDINNALLAILSQNSGPTAPTTTKPFMFWYDTTVGVLRMRNAADTAWIAAIDGITGSASQTMKNRIINGDMRIDQRSLGASSTSINGYYSVDRWAVYGGSLTGKGTYGQNYGGVTPPAGFKNYWGWQTGASAYSVAAADLFSVFQPVEGYNVADLGFGSSSASPITISFWVRSSITGTFGASVVNAAQTYNYPFTYTINAANTWEQKVVTIAGATAGTWLTTNGNGLQVNFIIGSGSNWQGTPGAWTTTNYQSATGAVSVLGTANATWQITGVQLEKGSQATAFDFREYGEELRKCQRYLPAISHSGGANPYFGAGMAFGTTSAYYTIGFPVTPRVPPTGVTVSAASHFAGFLASTATSNATGVVFGGANNHSAFIQLTGMTGLTGGNASMIFMNTSAAQMLFSGCEL